MLALLAFLVPLVVAQFQQPTLYPQQPYFPVEKPPLLDVAGDAHWDLNGGLMGKIDKYGINIGGGADLDVGADFGLGIGQKRPTWPGDKIKIPDTGVLGIGGRAEYGLGGFAGAALDADGLAAGIGAHEHKFLGLGATVGGK